MRTVGKLRIYLRNFSYSIRLESLGRYDMDDTKKQPAMYDITLTLHTNTDAKLL